MPLVPANSLEDKVRATLVEIGSFSTTFAPDDDFYSDLGMPSVKAMQLLLELEDRFQIAIPDDRFVEATTLRSLCAMLEDLQAKSAQ